MRIFHGFDSLPDFRDAVVTLGSFDGVHGGHRKLLGEVIATAEKIGGESIVLTFEPHPRIALGRGEVPLLTTIEEKSALLEQSGIDNLIVIPFDEKFRMVSSCEFISRFIVDAIGARVMIVGYNHRFGHDCADFEQLQQLGIKYGLEVRQVTQYRSDEDKVSSTVIRESIMAGEMVRATRLLSHGYIIRGESQNSKIEITNRYKLLPPNGIYHAMTDNQPIVVEISERTLMVADGAIADGWVSIIL